MEFAQVANSEPYGEPKTHNLHHPKPHLTRQPARTEWYVRAGKHVGQASNITMYPDV
jgi:hypothetical protein